MTNRPNNFHPALLTSLQGVRAIAAILVAFFHAGVFIFALDKYWGYDPSRHFFDFGHAGVELFFVLSGFIIYYIHEKDLDRPSRFFSYAIKRFLRIYPIYWIILATVICIYFLVPSFGLPYQREAGTILSSALLVHVNGNSNTELASAWTLYHEMLFYGFFSLAILNRRIGMAVIAVWLLASAATLVIPPPSYALEFLLSPFHLLFGMGMISCWMVNRANIASPRLVALVGVLIFIAAGMEENYVLWLGEMPRNLIYGFGSAFILVGVVELERRGCLKVPDMLLLIGNASYVIYLINFTALSFLAKIFIYTGAKEVLPAFVSYLLVTALSVFFGALVYFWIERPMLRFLRGQFLSQADRKTNSYKAFYVPLRESA